jgi:hypothetical protein
VYLIIASSNIARIRDSSKEQSRWWEVRDAAGEVVRRLSLATA